MVTNMKHVVLISLLALAGCSPSPEEKAILNHEQLVDGVKTDLAMNIKSMEKTGVITAADSIKPLNDLMDILAQREVRELNLKMDRTINLIREQNLVTITATTKPRIDQAKESMATYQMILDTYKQMLKQYQDGDYSKTDFRNIYERMKRYESKPDSVLASKYLCTYTIKNPAMNFAKQEITKMYHIRDNRVVYAGK